MASTTPFRRNRTVMLGDTHSFTFTVTDPAGAPVTITGRTYRAQVKSDAAGSAIASFSVTNPTSSSVQFLLTATATAAVPVGTYFYDVEQTNGATVTTLMFGLFTVSQDVSRA